MNIFGMFKFWKSSAEETDLPLLKSELVNNSDKTDLFNNMNDSTPLFDDDVMGGLFNNYSDPF